MHMGKYVVTVDQSTSASKVFLLDGQGEIVRRFSKNHKQYYPQPGYVEHDAEEIWWNVRAGIRAVTEGLSAAEIAAIGISNQRETTVLWERGTGLPVCRAVVWQDVRGEALCKRLAAHGPKVLQKTGLLLSPYYPAAKAASVLAEQPGLKQKAADEHLCIGTMDSYLVYRLTEGKLFQTDVSNASRTELMALKTLAWDADLLQLFGIPSQCLPRIAPSDGDFGYTDCEGLLAGIPIAGVMGDSHAALFGQGCVEKGMAKATYGTGSSMMMHVGAVPAQSQNGLSASVGFGFEGHTGYVLEGNITCSGDTLCWLRDEVGLIETIDEAESLAASVQSTENVFLVPAFSGLGAPYFDGHARAMLWGMNRGTTKAHIVRAALESMAYQNAEVIDAIEKDTGVRLSELRADGGPTHNALLMQFQADILGCTVRCAARSELSALGAGYMAGIRAGVYSSLQEIPARSKQGTVYTPQLSQKEREDALESWRAAVKRCR